MYINSVDKWFIDLTQKFEGYGMLIYIAIVLTLSGVLAGVIGLERYRKGKNAGIRTHALLAMSCAFLMAVSVWAIHYSHYYAPDLNHDVSRIAAGAITGIGFLGAGVIIKDKFNVKGLSTAVTLWIAAAIGLGCGAGFILEAVICAIVTMIILAFRQRVIALIDMKAPYITVKAKTGYPIMERIKEICDINQIDLKKMDVTSCDEKETVVKAYYAYKVNPLLLEYCVSQLKKEEGVISAERFNKQK